MCEYVGDYNPKMIVNKAKREKGNRASTSTVVPCDARLISASRVIRLSLSAIKSFRSSESILTARTRARKNVVMHGTRAIRDYDAQDIDESSNYFS